jgi:hypothetical protein
MVLSRVSPLAVPVLLEIGRESVRTRDDEEKLLAEAEAIIAEATAEQEPRLTPLSTRAPCSPSLGTRRGPSKRACSPDCRAEPDKLRARFQRAV